MPVRLPIPGSDEGQWGDILNQFLAVEHNNDGTLKTSGSLATKANATHTHTQSDVTGLSAALTTKYTLPAGGIPETDLASAVQTKLNTAGGGGVPDDGSVTNAKVAPDAAIAQSKIANLVDDLAGKQAAGSYAAASHTHTLGDLSNVNTGGATNGQSLVFNSGSSTWSPATVSSGDGVTDHALLEGLDGDDHPQYALADGSRGDFAATSHDHVISNVTGLQSALDGKQATGDYATTSALTSGLSGKANTAHSHVQSDVTGLSDALAAKADSSQVSAFQAIGTISSSGNTNIPGGGAVMVVTATINSFAGTRTFTLQAGVTTGSIRIFRLTIGASAGAVEFRNLTAGGTLLGTITGGDNAQSLTIVTGFQSTNWLPVVSIEAGVSSDPNNILIAGSDGKAWLAADAFDTSNFITTAQLSQALTWFVPTAIVENYDDDPPEGFPEGGIVFSENPPE